MSTEKDQQQNADGVVVTAPAQSQPLPQPGFGTWYFDSKTDEAMGVETFRYDNGGVSKRCKLSDGKEAVCHRLKGKDRLTVKRACGNDKEKFEDALIAVCTKIDDKSIVLEDLDTMWFDDVLTIQTMASTLNFT